jgi:two-component system CheB/CheR fusion protein
MYGWSEAEALNMNIRECVPKTKLKEFAAFTEKIKNNEPVESFVTQRLCKNRKILAVWLTVTGLKDEGNRTVESATTERDVTEFKKIESQSTC